ncbi:MAG: DUF2029 domain-containing protein [Mycobacterium sp.]|nr:MAG: DUF2029 domain-containing protein [Mycobacterium sp.]
MGILIATVLSAVSGFILAQYYSIDVLSSLLSPPYDCMADWGTAVGRHCFSDYAIPVSFGLRANPWEPYPLYLPPDFKPAYNNYPAAGMLPAVIFGAAGKWLGIPNIGLLGYLIVLAAACFSPAIWAARAEASVQRVVVFVACGAAAIPAWMAIDRGNSVGFVVPIMLMYLVALCRQRWGQVCVMVILAALVKPQFSVMLVVLLAARRWRLAGVTVAGIVASNLAAYALWPRQFPRTIAQTIHNTLGYGSGSMSVTNVNVSFGKGLLMVADGMKAARNGGVVPNDFLAGPRNLLGYAVLLIVVVSTIALGRRIPPVMAGVALIATASLFPAVSNRYYLVFALPIAALIVRYPDGPSKTGLFDCAAATGGRRRALAICVVLATAISLAQIALPGPPSRIEVMGPTAQVWATLRLVETTVALAPIAWLIACLALLISYVRRPAFSDASEQARMERDHAGGGATDVLEPIGRDPNWDETGQADRSAVATTSSLANPAPPESED